MITIKRSAEVLKLIKEIYPELSSAVIEFKHSYKFAVKQDMSGHYIVTIQWKMNQESYLVKNIWTYLKSEYGIDESNYMFPGSTEYFALLHEIGHIVGIELYNLSLEKARDDALSYMDNINSGVFNCEYKKFSEYRNLEAERFADKFAVDILSSELVYKISAIANNKTEEEARVEMERWKLLLAN